MVITCILKGSIITPTVRKWNLFQTRELERRWLLPLKYTHEDWIDSFLQLAIMNSDPKPEMVMTHNAYLLVHMYIYPLIQAWEWSTKLTYEHLFPCTNHPCGRWTICNPVPLHSLRAERFLSSCTTFQISLYISLSHSLLIGFKKEQNPRAKSEFYSLQPIRGIREMKPLQSSFTSNNYV